MQLLKVFLAARQVFVLYTLKNKVFADISPTALFYRGFMVVLADPDPVHLDSVPSFAAAPALPSVLTRLRLETRSEHEAVERVLDLMGGLSNNSYRQRLVQFYGFYRPLEAALQIRCAKQSDSHSFEVLQLQKLLPRLHKSLLLRQDLHQLGITAAGLAQCRALPPIQTYAEVLGCLYVLEGATLGGRMITQHVQATLGITPTSGGSFFDGYAGQTARMWNALRQTLLSAAVDAQAENAMVASAVATFTCLRGWCASAPSPDSSVTVHD